MIQENVRKLLEEIPGNVTLQAAAKSRTPAEVREAVEAGVTVIGENYVQEAEAALQAIGRPVPFHFIGHLQTNKVKKAVGIFDMIETVDTVKLAREIDRRCGQTGNRMPVLIEVNSGREPQKFGVLPENLEDLVREVSELAHIQVQGLMTMGPFSGDPENARPYFRETKKSFDRIRSLNIPNVEMTVLSMGMSNSFRVAIQEGATMIRVGTLLFGPRAV
jgi:pyridoxal phosphate enzyme (YggS family)